MDNPGEAAPLVGAGITAPVDGSVADENQMRDLIGLGPPGGCRRFRLSGLHRTPKYQGGGEGGKQTSRAGDNGGRARRSEIEKLPTEHVEQPGGDADRAVQVDEDPAQHSWGTRRWIKVLVAIHSREVSCRVKFLGLFSQKRASRKQRNEIISRGSLNHVQ